MYGILFTYIWLIFMVWFLFVGLFSFKVHQKALEWATAKRASYRKPRSRSKKKTRRGEELAFFGVPQNKHTRHFNIVTILSTSVFLPIASMYGIFTYIYHKHQLNVGKYTIHGWYGLHKHTTWARYKLGTRKPPKKLPKRKRLEVSGISFFMMTPA